MLIDFLVPKLRFLPRNKERKRQLHTIHFGVLVLCCLFAPEERGDPSLLAGRCEASDKGSIFLYGWGKATCIGQWADLCETVAAESCSLCIVLRHRTLSSPIYFAEVTHKPLALSRVFLLSSGGKSAIPMKEKAPSRSDFSVSTYVVLKTRHANPNIHVRRFIVHVRSPNLSTTRPQLLSLRGATTYYGFAPHTNSCLHSSPIIAG